jgi:protein tyrosine phosphatase
LLANASKDNYHPSIKKIIGYTSTKFPSQEATQCREICNGIERVYSEKYFKDRFKDLKQSIIEQRLHINTDVCLSQTIDQLACIERTCAFKTKNSYLHANYLKLFDYCGVASQYPLTKTSLELFVEFCATSKVSRILNLTNPDEPINIDSKNQVQYAKVYFPTEPHPSLKIGDYTITLNETKQINNGFVQYNYTIQGANTKKSLTYYHYTNWIDQSDINVSELASILDTIGSSNIDDVLLTHCKMGLGRTGTIITAQVLKQRIEERMINKENLLDELDKIILYLRRQRGPGFVQKDNQYILLAEYGASLLNFQYIKPKEEIKSEPVAADTIAWKYDATVFNGLYHAIASQIENSTEENVRVFEEKVLEEEPEDDEPFIRIDEELMIGLKEDPSITLQSLYGIVKSNFCQEEDLKTLRFFNEQTEDFQQVIFFCNLFKEISQVTDQTALANIFKEQYVAWVKQGNEGFLKTEEIFEEFWNTLLECKSS